MKAVSRVNNFFTPSLAPESASGQPLSLCAGKSNRVSQRGFSRLRDFFFVLASDLYFL